MKEQPNYYEILDEFVDIFRISKSTTALLKEEFRDDISNNNERYVIIINF